MAKTRRNTPSRIQDGKLPSRKKISIPGRIKRIFPFLHRPEPPITIGDQELNGENETTPEPENTGTASSASSSTTTGVSGGTDPGNSTSTTSTSSDMEPFVGEIRMFAGPFAPRGWAFCDGQILNISENSALFSLLGTTYGGDGRTTFGLPDLRGRTPLHAGQGPGLSNYLPGASGGMEKAPLSIVNLPSHTHQVNCAAGDADASEPSGKTLASGQMIYGEAEGSTNMAQDMISETGQNQPVPIMQPYLAVNFIIALEGIFPSRS